MTKEQVINSVQPAYAKHDVPYHIELQNAVKNVQTAARFGYPLDLEWIEIQRDLLSKILDAKQ